MTRKNLRRNCLLLAVMFGSAWTPLREIQAAQPSSAEAAQQVAAGAGVSPTDVEILSITFAGTEVRGDEIVERWNIQYRIKDRSSPQSSAFQPTDGQNQQSAVWPFDSSTASNEEAVSDATVAFDPVAQPAKAGKDQRANQRLFLGLAISVCVLVFVGLAGVVAWQIIRVRTPRKTSPMPPPLPPASGGP